MSRPPSADQSGGRGAHFVFFCDHTGQAFKVLRHLRPAGSGAGATYRLDIGIAKLARRLATGLNAPAALAIFWLVIDCSNRRLSTINVDPRRKATGYRFGQPWIVGIRPAGAPETIFRPYHNVAFAARIRRKVEGEGHAGGDLATSFTLVMNCFQRPWHIGVLWNKG